MAPGASLAFIPSFEQTPQGVVLPRENSGADALQGSHAVLSIVSFPLAYSGQAGTQPPGFSYLYLKRGEEDGKGVSICLFRW